MKAKFTVVCGDESFELRDGDYHVDLTTGVLTFDCLTAVVVKGQLVKLIDLDHFELRAEYPTIGGRPPIEKRHPAPEPWYRKFAK